MGTGALKPLNLPEILIRVDKLWLNCAYRIPGVVKRASFFDKTCMVYSIKGDTLIVV